MKKTLIIIIVVFLFSGGIFLLLREDDKIVVIERNGEEVIERVDKEATEIVKEILLEASEAKTLNYRIKKESFGEEIFSQFWQKGERMRMVTSVTGRDIINLWDNKEDSGYMYMGGDVIATEIERNQARDVLNSSIKEWISEALENDFVAVGQEEVEGKECFIIKYETEERETRLWISKNEGFPLKIEKNFDWGKREKIVSDINLEDFSDKVFSLPEGMETTKEIIFF